MEVQASEQGIVVQHLLEVRHEPERVHGVPVKAAPELVVDPSHGHPVQRSLHHLQRLRVASPEVLPQQELVHHRLRELGLKPETAVLTVELRRQVRERPVHHVRRERLHAARPCRRLPHVGQQLFRSLDYLRPVVPVRRCDGLQHPRKRRQAPAVLGREVGTAVERLAVRRHEHRHRPAPLARHRLDRAHVDRVHVGPLLPVDLYVHEILVHCPRDVLVLEGLALHHVAPVARRVADAQHHRPVLLLGASKGLVAPRIPVHRIVGVLEQVGARLLGQSVRHDIAAFPKSPQSISSVVTSIVCMSATRTA